MSGHKRAFVLSSIVLSSIVLIGGILYLIGLKYYPHQIFFIISPLLLLFLGGFLPKAIASAAVPVFGWVVVTLSIAYMAYQGFLFWENNCAH